MATGIPFSFLRNMVFTGRTSVGANLAGERLRAGGKLNKKQCIKKQFFVANTKIKNILKKYCTTLSNVVVFIKLRKKRPIMWAISSISPFSLFFFVIK